MKMKLKAIVVPVVLLALILSTGAANAQTEAERSNAETGIEQPRSGAEDAPQPTKNSEDYWEKLIGVLLAFALLALTIERALYQIFDSKLWKFIEEKVDAQAGGDYMDLKPWISVAISVTIALRLEVDFIAVVLKRENGDFLSMVLTGLFLAGGSTGVYKFLKRAREIKDALAKEKQPGSP